MTDAAPLLSVVVPVYNQAGAIADNVSAIRDRVAAGLDEPFELIVVSDGSLDGTEQAVLERRLPGTRVLHYLRNLGKGYALKMGGLEARGEWVAFVDADLDLDPGALPGYLQHARSRGLDYAIGSKRHPCSRVHYPRSRRVGSWSYQRLVRLLFRLDVRDTQVGLKVFRRQVLDDVLPLLLVKRYAFDLELLAVARALGYERGEELPVTLDYRFSGSGVRSIAVLRALVDTFAIAYRLRVLGYYERRRSFAAGVPRREAASVTLVRVEGDPIPELEGAEPAHLAIPRDEPGARAEAAARAETELIAFIEPRAAPAANWLSAGTALFGSPEVGAVVTPALAPARGSLAERIAAAVRESRLGGGTMYFRFTPGNIRFVERFPGACVIVRRDLYLRVAPIENDDLCSAIVAAGARVLYTPETVVVAPPPPLVAPHLTQTWAHGVRQGRLLRASTVLAVAGLALVFLGWPLLWVGGALRALWLTVFAAYALAVTIAAAIAMLRFRSPAVGVAALAAFPATHLVYAAAVLRGTTRSS